MHVVPSNRADSRQPVPTRFMDEECSDGPLRATDRPRTCANCGDAIDTREWYPVASVPEEGYRIYAFCDEGCRDTWRQQTDR